MNVSNAQIYTTQQEDNPHFDLYKYRNVMLEIIVGEKGIFLRIP
jgi:hypothetical protein